MDIETVACQGGMTNSPTKSPQMQPSWFDCVDSLTSAPSDSFTTSNTLQHASVHNSCRDVHYCTWLSVEHNKLRQTEQKHLDVKRTSCVERTHIRSRHLATTVNFLVTCVQPDTLHISHHYEWMHLPPWIFNTAADQVADYLWIINPVDFHELVCSVLMWRRDKLSHRNRYVVTFAFVICALLIFENDFE